MKYTYLVRKISDKFLLLRSKELASVFFIISAFLLFSCTKKKEFLEEKPNSDLVVPSTLKDFQQLLDQDKVFAITPDLAELSADNYYTQPSWWTQMDNKSRNGYIWAPDIYEGQINILDWNICYQQVFYTNIVLEGLNKISDGTVEWKQVRGSALFKRAYAFFNLSQIFAPVYDSATAAADMGIPLRLQSDVNIVSVRSSVKETYEQIINDLLEANSLLVNGIVYNFPNRPSKPAVSGLLARVYLSMRNYSKAFEYANLCLQQHNKLIDYNTLSTTAVLPFATLHDEAIYQTRMDNLNAYFSSSNADVHVDSILYRSYVDNDLRKIIFFRLNTVGLPRLKGSYFGNSLAFTGLATDEIFLIRAECYARAGNIAAAMSDLNILLAKRWKTGTFIPFTATDPADALIKVLTERRKELVFRNLRWSDLRRLNKEGANITLTRVLNGQTYTLPPNDLRYVLPIPTDEIALSGIPQNPR